MSLKVKQEELIEKVARDNGFEDYTLSVEEGSQKGDNFLSSIKRITISGLDRKQGLILKTTLAEKNSGAKNIRNLYLREIFVYEKLFPEFASFEEEHNITKKFTGHPKLFATNSSEDNEMLVLEDMRIKNFQMHSKKRAMNSHHIKLILAEYAKFHAVGMALKVKNEERFQNLAKNLDNMIFENMNSTEEHKKTRFKSVYNNIMKSVEDDPVATANVNLYLKNMDNKIFFKADPDDRLTILHSDCWCNNFLFKYKDSDTDEPTEVCIIDWQLSKVGTPGQDLSHFLLVNASKDILNNYKFYLRLYHDELSKKLVEFSCNIEDIFPYTQLESHFGKYCRAILPFCSVMMRILMCEPDEAPEVHTGFGDMKKMEKIVNFDISNLDGYYKRLGDLVRFMSENNFLN